MGDRNPDEAAKHRRTPKRQRVADAFKGGHVLECGSALPL